ncbi:SRPBCC family protein [Actinokineospora sp. 24-640]
MIDVDHQISSVARSVGSRTLEAGEARVVTVSQTYKADVDDVWDAVTNPERLPRWFLPITGELRLGGHYQLEGNAGGVVERCDPPTGFAATWEFGGEVSWIEVTIGPDDAGGTRLRLEHIAHVDDERWAEFGPGAVGLGWDLGVMGLNEHLSGAPAVEPASAMAWMASPEGIEFMTRANTEWRDASVAAGTEPAAAQAAADRTIAAYTAAP